jgi:intracellular sulfur oxidation DsrE/DsrF family protein
MVAGLGTEGSVAAMLRTQESTPAASGRPEIPPDFKVVLHVAEPDRWPETLSNLSNLAQEWPQAQLRVVVDGSAVLALQGENHVTKELAKVVSAKVQVQVCPNALRDQGVDPATIPAYAHTALGGVVALVVAQHDGFAYVKP